MLTLEEDGYSVGYRQLRREAAIQKLLDYPHTVIVEGAGQIDANVFTTGALEAEVKEQSVVVNIPGKGLVIIAGCSHPTLPVIIESARRVTNINQIYGIVGGLHYAFSSNEDIIQAVSYIESLQPAFVVPSHCTGYKAIRRMQDILGDKIHVSATGQFGTGNSFTVLPELTFNFR